MDSTLHDRAENEERSKGMQSPSQPEKSKKERIPPDKSGGCIRLDSDLVLLLVSSFLPPSSTCQKPITSTIKKCGCNFQDVVRSCVRSHLRIPTVSLVLKNGITNLHSALSVTPLYSINYPPSIPTSPLTSPALCTHGLINEHSYQSSRR